MAATAQPLPQPMPNTLGEFNQLLTEHGIAHVSGETLRCLREREGETLIEALRRRSREPNVAAYLARVVSEATSQVHRQQAAARQVAAQRREKPAGPENVRTLHGGPANPGAHRSGDNHRPRWHVQGPQGSLTFEACENADNEPGLLIRGVPQTEGEAAAGAIDVHLDTSATINLAATLISVQSTAEALDESGSARAFFKAQREAASLRALIAREGGARFSVAMPPAEVAGLLALTLAQLQVAWPWLEVGEIVQTMRIAYAAGSTQAD